MKKLENIPKKNIYEVPDGYFDKLPGIIQARVSNEKPKQAFVFSWVSSLKYALPAVLIGVAAIFWYNQSAQQSLDTNAILASIDTDVLMAYIDESDITTDELLDSFPLDTEEVLNIESEVFGSLYEDDLDGLIDEFDIDLNNL